MAIHSSILARRVPWIEEPGGLKVHRVTKSRTQLKQLSMNACIYKDISQKKQRRISSELFISNI